MRRFKWLVVPLGVAVALVVGASGAGAGVTPGAKALGAEVRVSSAAADEVLPAVAWNATAGQYLVVWEDWRAEGAAGADIYGRRLGANGSPVGGDFLVVAGPSSSKQGAPAVAWNATANQYLVVWQDWRNGSYPDIYGRRLGAGGAGLAPEFRISTLITDAAQMNPAVAWNAAANQYLVVWDDYRAEATRSTDIFGRLVSAAGAAVGADFRISRVATLSAQLSPAVASNPAANEYLVVWEDHRDEGDYRIFGRRVDGNGGVPLEGDLRISGGGAQNALVPAVAWNGTAGEYLVVWEDWRNYTDEMLNIAGVYGRRVAADGTALDRDLRVSSRNATGGAWGPSLAWNALANRYFVAWTDGRNVVWDGPDQVVGNDIYGRRLESDGSPAGADLRLSTATSSEIDSAVAANTIGGSFFAVWCDFRNGETSGGDVYGRKVPG